MDFLSTVWRQVSRIYGRLTASQRVTFLLLVLMIGGSLTLLVVLGSGTDWAPLMDRALDGDQAAKVHAQLTRAGIAYRESGGQVQVRPADRYRALAALSEGNALPRGFGFPELLARSGGVLGMQTREEQNFQQQLALQTELEKTLCEFQGVRGARVLISQSPQRALDFRAPKAQTASVSLWLTDGADLSAHLVSSAANLVAYSVLGLKPQNVSIIDANRGLSQRVPEEEEGLFAATLLQQKREIERYLTQKIYGQLSFIPGRVVGVGVELRPESEVRDTHTVRPDESVIPRRDVERTDRPSVSVAAPGAPTAGTSGGATIPPPALAAGRETTETTSEILEGQFSTDRSHRIIPAGQIERITASIVIPLSYYREMATKRSPAGQEPTEAQVQAAADQDKPNVQKIALGVLGPKAKADDVAVDARFVPTEPTVTAAVTSGGMLRLVERYGATAVLGTLSLAFLALLGRWVKRPAGEAAPAGVRPTAAAAAAAAAIQDDVAVLLPNDGEMSVEARRVAEMRKRIQDLVKQDPANAASLVSRWLSQG